MAITEKKPGFPKRIKEEKRQVVERIKDMISRSSLALLVEMGNEGVYMNAMDFVNLNLLLKEEGRGGMYVAKNTLSRIALKELGIDIDPNLIRGQNFWLFAYDDPVAFMKVLDKYWSDLKKEFRIKVLLPKPKFGILEGKVLSADQVVSLAKLPPKEQMIAKLLATMNAPITNLVWVLKNSIARIVWVLKAIEEKKREQAEG